MGRPAPANCLIATDVFYLLNQAFTMHLLGGKACELYGCWVPVANKRLLAQVFRRTTSQSYASSIKKIIQSNQHQPVMITAPWWHPASEFTYRILKDHLIMLSLFISMYGHRNLNPCDCCSSRYVRTLRDTEQGMFNVMKPYSECISLDTVQSGACSNCIYHKEGNKCSFSQAGMFNLTKKLGYIPDQLKRARAVSTPNPSPLSLLIF